MKTKYPEFVIPAPSSANKCGIINIPQGTQPIEHSVIEDNIFPTLDDIVLSADELGFLQMQAFAAESTEDLIDRLSVLEQLGFVEPYDGSNRFAPFQLTPRGVKVKNILAKSRQQISQNA